MSCWCIRLGPLSGIDRACVTFRLASGQTSAHAPHSTAAKRRSGPRLTGVLHGKSDDEPAQMVGWEPPLLPPIAAGGRVSVCGLGRSIVAGAVRVFSGARSRLRCRCSGPILLRDDRAGNRVPCRAPPTRWLNPEMQAVSGILSHEPSVRRPFTRSIDSGTDGINHYRSVERTRPPSRRLTFHPNVSLVDCR